VPHLPAFATLSLTVKVHARTVRAEGKLCKADKLGHVVRRAEQVEHRGGRYFERSRVDGEGEDSAQMILVL